MKSPVIVTPAPYVFARHRPKQPSIVQVVTMTMRPVLCHNACGLYYVAATDEEMQPGDACPDCNAPPKPWRVGEAEEVESAVHMAFGNLVDVAFLRTRGSLSTRFVNVALAFAIVKNPPR